jgi:hypothetical protein
VLGVAWTARVRAAAEIALCTTASWRPGIVPSHNLAPASMLCPTQSLDEMILIRFTRS